MTPKIYIRDDRLFLSGFIPKRIKDKLLKTLYSLHENSKQNFKVYDSKILKNIVNTAYVMQSEFEIPIFVLKYKEVQDLINQLFPSHNLDFPKSQTINILAKVDCLIFPMSQQKDTINALNEELSIDSSYGNEPIFKCLKMKLQYFSIHNADDFIVDVKHEIVAILDKEHIKMLEECYKILEYKKTFRKARRPILNIHKIHKKYPMLITHIVSTSNSETIIKYLNIKKAIDDKIPQLIIERAFLNAKSFKKTITYYFDETYYYTSEDVNKNHQLIIDYILKNELKDIKDIIQKASLVSKSESKSVMDAITKSKFKAVLRPHQKIGVSWLSELLNKGVPGAILADDMGMGKTVQAIGLIAYALQTKKIRTILVVAPASVVGVWQNEIKTFYPEILKKVVIQSYESARAEVLEYDLIILDEGQKIKNAKTIAANVLSRAKATFKLILSGTPIENSVQDLFSLILVITRDASSVLQKITKLSKDDVQHVKTTASIFEPIMLSRKISLDILPAKLNKEFVNIELSSDEKMVYSGISQFYSKKLKTITNNSEFYREAIVAILRMLQSVSSPKSVPNELFTTRVQKIKDNLTSSKITKIKELTKLTNKFSQDKFVVFARFKETIKSIKDQFPDALIINGDVTKDARTKTVEKFQEGNNQMIIISLQAGATGLTLTAANKLVFVDLWWNPAVMEQAVRRIYRIGQEQDCTAYYFIANNTIDKGIMQSIDSKSILINALDDKPTQSISNNGDSTGAVKLIDNLFK